MKNMENIEDKFLIRFPGDIEYIPSIRRYVADILQANNFGPKFMYRTEVIVDEICSNSVRYGCPSLESFIELECMVCGDRVEFNIRDEGGSEEDRKKLKKVVQRKDKDEDSDFADYCEDNKLSGMGLEIVRLLSEKVDVKINSDNITSVHVVRKREGKKENVENENKVK